MSGARLVLSLLHEGALVGSLQVSHEEGEAGGVGSGTT